MNKIKIPVNENDYIEFSADTAEILLCKQFLNPISTDYTQFVFDNFNREWLRSQERKDLFSIAKVYWEKRGSSVPSAETMRQIFKNPKFAGNEARLLKEYEEITGFNEAAIDPFLVRETLKSFIKGKSIYFAIMENLDTLNNEGAAGNLLSRFERIVQLDLSDDLGVEYFENFDNHCSELTERNDKTPFGFKWLDAQTYGGLPSHDTCLMVVMAKPGFGKSQFMMNIAVNWIASNKKVLMISLEMSESMYSRRMDGLFSNLNINRLRDTIGELKSRVKGFKANAPDAQLMIKEFPTGTLTPSMLKQYIRKLKQTKNFTPDIIFVDYLNIMRPDGNNAAALSLYEKAGRIAEELRAISGEMKIPVVTATQQNRGANGYAGESIGMDSVSESSCISATADVMVAIWGEDGDRENGVKRLKVLKNRLGKGVDMSTVLRENMESLKMMDGEDDAPVDDDVLGDVMDASNDVLTGRAMKTTETAQASQSGILEDL